MSYLEFQEYEDRNGYGDEIMPEADPYEGLMELYQDPDTRYRSQMSTYAASSKAPPKDAYWKGNSPVMKKVEHSGESENLPVIAPREEKDVTVRQVILQQTMTIIQNHHGGSRVNWNWRMQIFASHMLGQCPSLMATSTQLLTQMNSRVAMGVHVYTDAALYGATVQDSLAINDPGDANAILADSRRDCRWIGMTFTFNPQSIRVLGTTVNRNLLPEASSVQIYIRAPQDAGGLDALVTKAMLTGATPENVFRVGVPAGAPPAPEFYVVKTGRVPQQDDWIVWWENQKNRTYFYAMKQIAQKEYVRALPPTDSLKQRFMKVQQRHGVAAYDQEIQTLVGETSNMSAAMIQDQVPDLCTLFYNGLLDRMKTGDLARLTQHAAPPANLGENLDRLRAIVDRALEEEERIDRIDMIVGIANPGRFKRNTVGGDTRSRTDSSNAATGGRTFTTTAGTETTNSPTRFPAILHSAFLPTTPRDLQSIASFAITMVSNVEKSLVDSTGTRAPMKCWGCDGIHENSDHMFRDCPHKHERQVQMRYKAKLDDHLQKRRRGNGGANEFKPDNYRKDGFHSKKAVSMYNAIGTGIEPAARTSMIEAFVEEVAEATQNLKISASASKKRKPDQGNGSPSSPSQGVISLPSYLIDDRDMPTEEEGTHEVTLQTHKTNSTQPEVDNFTLRYPITNEFPHGLINVGKNSEATVDSMVNTGGACSMGEHDYWHRAHKKLPHIFARFEELATYQERPIPIGGVGEGRVLITHICEFWMPWTIDGEQTKLVVGLGQNMPMTLLLGLPFLIATQSVIDIGNLTCYSKTFDHTWKLTLKRPQRKDARTLDATLSSGKRFALPTQANVRSAVSQKKPKWTWDVAELQDDDA